MISSTRLERSRSAIRHRSTNPIQSSINNPSNKTQLEYTCVVLGDMQVGKTAIVSQFLWNESVREYHPTIEEFNWIEYDIGDESILLLQVIDSSGSRDFLAMRHLYIRTGNVFMVVFSVDDSKSGEEAKKIVGEIQERKRNNVPIFLIANKIDLYDDEGEWKVRDMAIFARQNGIPFIKITAMDEEDVYQLFQRVFHSLNPNGSIDSICGSDLKKRRQSMPVVTRSSMAITPQDIHKLQRKHKTHCSIQ